LYSSDKRFLTYILVSKEEVDKMGIFIFLTAVIIEIAIAVFCIITKSYQKHVRNTIRITYFTVFTVLIMLKVIQWHIRYYAIAAFLGLLFTAGVVSLIRMREVKKAYKLLHIILKAVGMIALFLIFLLPAVIFPEPRHINPTGEYEITTVNYTYIDTKRVETYSSTRKNRELNVKFWYPENREGTYPLIVFSHGSFGIKSSNETLYKELASYGYVVCSIDHTYQCFFTVNEDGHRTWMNRGYMKQVISEDSRYDKDESVEYYKEWMEIRTRDINFVIDYILEEVKNRNLKGVYELIDITKIGVMGHSLGGSAALGIGRSRDDISAVIALESPFLYDIQGVKEGEFAFIEDIYPVPVLNVYSDKGIDVIKKWPQYAKNKALLSGGNANSFNVYIRGVGHLSLTDLSLTSPVLTRILNGHKSTTDTEDCLKVINKISLEFFNTYLKGQGQFTSGAIH
jgi:dienelactone hydrolase